MRNPRLFATAISACVIALAAHALAQGAPAAPPPAPPPPPPGSAAPATPEAPPPAGSTTPPAPPAGSAEAPPAAAAPPAPPPPPAQPLPPPAPPPAAAPPAPPPAAAPLPPPGAPATPPEAEPDKKQEPKPPKSTVGLEVMLGAGSRADRTSSGYTDASRGGLLLGGGLFFAPNRTVTVGVSYAGMYGAWEQYAPGDTFASSKINRTYHSVLANLRAYPLRNDKIGLWGGLALGATFQQARATGTDAAHDGPIVTPVTYTQTAGPKAGLALGLGIGLDYDLSNAVGILASANFMNHWLSADSLTSAPDRPVPGAGTATMFDFRIALQYRFDTSGAAIPASGSVKTSKR